MTFATQHIFQYHANIACPFLQGNAMNATWSSLYYV